MCVGGCSSRLIHHTTSHHTTPHHTTPRLCSQVEDSVNNVVSGGGRYSDGGGGGGGGSGGGVGGGMNLEAVALKLASLAGVCVCV